MLATHGGRPSGANYKELSGKSNIWRIASGEYRVVYKIFQAERVIRLLRVVHRQDADRVYREVATAEVPAGDHDFQAGMYPALPEQLWAKLCTVYKIDPDGQYPQIGSGSFGDAFDLHDGTVLKLTEDETEAVAAAKLLHRNDTPHLVRIFAVHFLKTGNTNKLWAIRQEKLQPADHKYVTMSSIWRKWRNYSSNERYITQKTVKEFEKGWAQFAEYVTDSDLIKQRDVKDFCKWLDDVAQETAAVGIKFWDLHGGNIMRREGASNLIDDHVIIDMGQSKVEGEEPEVDELEHEARMSALFDAVAKSVDDHPTDSDAYLIEQVMPSISDDQFAAVVGLHGFVLMNDLAVDMENQILEGILQHQEKELVLQLVIRGSYVTPHDGEWLVQIGPSSDEFSYEHQTFEYDPETDAVNLMKAVARLLGELSGDDEEETPSSQPDSLSGPASTPAPAPEPAPAPSAEESPPAAPSNPPEPPSDKSPGKPNPLA